MLEMCKLKGCAPSELGQMDLRDYVALRSLIVVRLRKTGVIGEA
jgi:hypothetical protein